MNDKLRRWVPNLRDPHSHVYFLLADKRPVAKIGPNPRSYRGEAPWLAYVGIGGNWKPVGGAWQKADAQELAEEALAAEVVTKGADDAE